MPWIIYITPLCAVTVGTWVFLHALNGEKNVMCYLRHYIMYVAVIAAATICGKSSLLIAELLFLCKSGNYLRTDQSMNKVKQL
jgi:hypothetical protein